MSGVNWLLDHQIHWDFFWVGFMWFKHRVITEIPPADAVTPPRSRALCLPDLHACQRTMVKHHACLHCRVATPSGSCWRSPRRRSPKRRGVAPPWSWRPRQVCECCPRRKPTLFWRRWEACILRPQTGANTTRPAMRQHEKPPGNHRLHVSLKKAMSLPSWWPWLWELWIVWSNHLCHWKHETHATVPVLHQCKDHRSDSAVRF